MIDVAHVAHRGMGFGQEIGGRGVYSYSLALPFSEAIASLSTPYRETARALESDEKYLIPGMDPHIDRLAALRYPPWSELVHDHPEIAEQLMRDVTLDWLEVLFPDTASPQYVINSVRKVSIKENQILIEGDGFVPSER
jgi:hypothetical protein